MSDVQVGFIWRFQKTIFQKVEMEISYWAVFAGGQACHWSEMGWKAACRTEPAQESGREENLHGIFWRRIGGVAG